MGFGGGMGGGWSGWIWVFLMERRGGWRIIRWMFGKKRRQERPAAGAVGDKKATHIHHLALPQVVPLTLVDPELV